MADGRKNNGGKRPGAGNPGYTHNKKMGKLVGASVDWALERMEDTNTDIQIKKDIVLKVLSKAVPQNLDLTTQGDKIVLNLNGVIAQKNGVAQATSDNS